MEEIEVNGKKYVLKDELKPSLKQSKNWMLDKFNIIGIGECSPENYVCTTISINFLEKAIEILKAVGQESATFAWAKDTPLIIGKENEGRVTGIVIAPRVERNAGE